MAAENTNIENKLNQLRARKTPEFSSREDLFTYAKDNYIAPISADAAYQDIQDNLLPVFQAAKELCEHLSGDEDYFHRHWGKTQMFHQMYAKDLPGDHGDRPIDRLYHMALISRIIKTINEHCGTAEEKKFCVHHADIVNDNYYLKNGQKQKTNGFMWLEENKGFKKVMQNSEVRCNFDDQYMHEYLGAFQEDVTPIFKNGKSCVSVNGAILDWQEMKKSAVFQIAAMPFEYAERARLYKEDGVKDEQLSISQRAEYVKRSEKNIQAKINAFCDMKQAQRQLQKNIDGNTL